MESLGSILFSTKNQQLCQQLSHQSIEDLDLKSMLLASVKVRHPEDLDRVVEFFTNIPPLETAQLRQQLFQLVIERHPAIEQLKALEFKLYALLEVEQALRQVNERKGLASTLRKIVLQLNRAKATAESLVAIRQLDWQAIGKHQFSDIEDVLKASPTLEELYDEIARYEEVSFRLSRIKTLKIGMELGHDLRPEKIAILEVSDKPLRKKSLLDRITGSKTHELTDNILQLYPEGVENETDANSKGILRVGEQKGTFIDANLKPLFDELGDMESALLKSAISELNEGNSALREQLLGLAKTLKAPLNNSDGTLAFRGVGWLGVFRSECRGLYKKQNDGSKSP